MAFEELLHLLSRAEAIQAKQNEVMLLSMRLSTTTSGRSMAFEELLHLLSRAEAIQAKQNEVMWLLMLAAAQMIASGEITRGDPEWRSIAARGEAHGLELLGMAAASVETSTQMAAKFAATPGREAVAEAHKRRAVSAAALGARAQEYVAFMRDALAYSDSDSAERPNAARRSRRPNAKYFGPEWSN